MKLLTIIILEIFLMVNNLLVIPINDLISSEYYHGDIMRIVRSGSSTAPKVKFATGEDVPDEVVSHISSALGERFSQVLAMFEALQGEDLVKESETGYELNVGGLPLILENYGRNGIKMVGDEFESVITADDSTQTVTINIPSLPGGGNATATFYSDGSADIHVEIEIDTDGDGEFDDVKVYNAKIPAGSEPLDVGSSLRIEAIAEDPVIHEPVQIMADPGNYPEDLVSFMARVERAIKNVLVTDEDGNVVTDIHGNIVPVYGMYVPQTPAENPTEGPMSRLMSIEDMLHETVLYVDNYIYEGDPNSTIVAGKEAALAGRFFEISQIGKLPYPTDPRVQEATDRLYEIVRNALITSPEFEGEPSSQEVEDRVDLLHYGIRVKLVSLHETLVQTAMMRPEKSEELGLPTSPEEIDTYINALVSALGPISVMGTILHPSQTSHDHWEGFLMRAVQLLGSAFYDPRMPTMPMYLSQACRFLWGDDRTFELKRRVQLTIAHRLRDPVAEQMVSDIIERRNNKPAVPMPLSPGGVHVMSGSHQYSRADAIFASLISVFLTNAALFASFWGLQSAVFPLAVGAFTVLGIYGLFGKVLGPVSHKIKEGRINGDSPKEIFKEALSTAVTGVSTLPQDWLQYQPLALLMPYMLVKHKIRSFTENVLDPKTPWAKPEDAHISNPFDAKNALAKFEKMADMFMANVVVPGAAGIYAYVLYQLMGPAWMWIGFPQMLGWGSFPVSQNTFLSKKYEEVWP